MLYLDRKQPVTQQILFPRLQFLFVTLNDRFRKSKKHKKKINIKLKKQEKHKICFSSNCRI